ncbi:MAG: phytoene/squalene synthase family protein [Verrucomicrobiales bacterium]|nr:squalene/phytoene synthase family protein [Akkermansiaceae bacterium]
MKPLPPSPCADAIVRASGSNLALAFAVLPRPQRRDMRVLYAFCRVIDDLADEASRPETERRQELDHWRSVLLDSTPPASGLEEEFTELQRRRALPLEHLLEIIEGVEMDVEEASFDTWEDLRLYCHRVAGAVGLVSLSIFGSHADRSRQYAEVLGQALQLTNILRDVGEDAARGRVYLPGEELDRAGLTRQTVLEWKGEPDARLRRLLEIVAARAREAYAEAEQLLIPQERPVLRSPILMGRLYRGILDQIMADGYRVFEKRYRPGWFTMMGAFTRTFLGVA